MRELKIGGEVVFGDGFGAENVEAGEHPAAAGGLLVGDSLGWHLVGEMVIKCALVREILGEFVDVVIHQGVLERFIGRIFVVGILNAFQHLRRDSLILREGGKG